MRLRHLYKTKVFLQHGNKTWTVVYPGCYKWGSQLGSISRWKLFLLFLTISRDCCSCCHVEEAGPLLEHLKWGNLCWFPALRISLSGLLSQKSVKGQQWEAGQYRGESSGLGGWLTCLETYSVSVMVFPSTPESPTPDMWVSRLSCMSSGMWTHLYIYIIQKTPTYEHILDTHTHTHTYTHRREMEREHNLPRREILIVLLHIVSLPFRTVSDTQ